MGPNSASLRLYALSLTGDNNAPCICGSSFSCRRKGICQDIRGHRPTARGNPRTAPCYLPCHDSRSLSSARLQLSPSRSFPYTRFTVYPIASPTLTFNESYSGIGRLHSVNKPFDRRRKWLYVLRILERQAGKIISHLLIFLNGAMRDLHRIDFKIGIHLDRIF